MSLVCAERLTVAIVEWHLAMTKGGTRAELHEAEVALAEIAEELIRRDAHSPSGGDDV